VKKRLQHCDSTCTHCAQEFWLWLKHRTRSRPGGRSGPGDFYEEAARSIKPEDRPVSEFRIKKPLGQHHPATPYDLKELDAGCIVELEHTKNRFKACKIARDHLHEDPKYYTKLCSVWPNENGCELVRSPIRAGWPLAFMAVGLGIAGVAIWHNRKDA
jgi:hypothetical protein